MNKKSLWMLTFCRAYLPSTARPLVACYQQEVRKRASSLCAHLITVFTAILVICGAVSVQAQKIEIVDKDGNAVPYASVMTADAALIGVTGMDGVIADIGGAKTVVISHVAYQPKTISILGDSSFSRLGMSPNDQTTNAPNNQECLRVTLEDADFNLPEITVTKKDYTYLQVYYRIVAISKDGVLFYRAGLVDNFYNEEKDKLDTSKQHFTKAKSAAMKTGGDMIMGFIVSDKATIHPETVEERLLKKYKNLGLKIVDGSGKKRIIDNYGTLGSITDKNGQRRITMDENLAYLHQLEAGGKTKKLDKEKKQEAKVENAVRNSYCAYRIDDSGNYRPEDFLMEQHLYSGDYEKHGHCVFIMDFFATDRGYYSKEGMKQVKKENKVKMTYNWAQQFERQHGIPALSPEVLSRIQELVDKD